jgi:hypothetical protein
VKTWSMLPPGCHPGIPAPRYHAIKAASASALRTIHASTPAHYAHQQSKGFAGTWETMIGELVHHAILEPSRPFPQLAIVPETYVVPADYKGGLRDPKPGDVEPWNRRRKFCKQWREQQEAAGLLVVEQTDLDEINRAVDAVAKCPEALEILRDSATEVTLIWEDADGFQCKARLDIVPFHSFLGDLKTCADASPEGFKKHAWDMGYHIQAAWYVLGWEIAGVGPKPGFRFIAYERGVGLVKVHRATSDFLRIGTEHAMAAFERFKACTESGRWDGYEPGLADLDVPRWARKEVGL